jgi:hypothetical protein
VNQVAQTSALDPATFFRCEHGSGNGPPCTMLKVRCVERQGKSWERKGATGTKRWVTKGSTFPFCASGECELGKAIAADVGALPASAPKRRNFGSVAALMRRAKPTPGPRAVGLTADQVTEVVARVRAAMKQPTRVATPPPPPEARERAPDDLRVDAAEVASHAPGRGKPGTPPAPHAPVNPEPPAQPALEAPMPCGSCGKSGHNSRSCTEKKNATPPKTKAIPAPPAPPKRGTTLSRPAVQVVARAATVEDLLARREALTVELASVEEQLRGRLAEEEARLEKLREAVAAAAIRAAKAA